MQRSWSGYINMAFNSAGFYFIGRLQAFLKELTAYDSLMLTFFPQDFYLVIYLDEVGLRYMFFPFYRSEN